LVLVSDVVDLGSRTTNRSLVIGGPLTGLQEAR
jgi:hypothetical protein